MYPGYKYQTQQSPTDPIVLYIELNGPYPDAQVITVKFTYADSKEYAFTPYEQTVAEYNMKYYLKFKAYGPTPGINAPLIGTFEIVYLTDKNDSGTSETDTMDANLYPA